MRFFRCCLVLGLFLILLAAVACGGDDDGGDGDSDSPTATPTPTYGNRDPFVPPFEGPPTSGTVTEQTDFRTADGWMMPDPSDLPAADESDDPILNPPEEPECPDGWASYARPTEGYQICAPSEWTERDSYVNSANEPRKFAMGIFDLVEEGGEIQRAHVSVYVIPRYGRPPRYILDCPQPYRIQFAGEEGIVCPEFPTGSPEARIASYHVYREELDYFVQVVSYYQYDAGDEEYTDDVEEDAFDVAAQIAHSFEFTPVARPD